MDQGNIQIENTLTKWVVYHDKKIPALVLEFYFVSDGNTFYKLQFSALPELFNQERKSFEELKESFKFRLSIF